MENFETNTYRDWEQWDRENVAQIIDSYWLGSPDEREHRKRLSSLVKQWISPSDRFLEVGCGSGLVYHQLVPDVIPNSSYVGVDISEAMLEIASDRFQDGTFFKNDLYGLTFPDRAFEIVAAFEVFGHIGDIEKPIQEMFRTASRLMIFTVWTGPETKITHEIIGHSVFIHKTFSEMDLMRNIDQALEGQQYTISKQPLSAGITAYIIDRHND